MVRKPVCINKLLPLNGFVFIKLFLVILIVFNTIHLYCIKWTLTFLLTTALTIFVFNYRTFTFFIIMSVFAFNFINSSSKIIKKNMVFVISSRFLPTLWTSFLKWLCSFQYFLLTKQIILQILLLPFSW